MGILCNRKGGFSLTYQDEQGRPNRIRLTHGVNDVDESLVRGAVESMPEAWQTAVVGSDLIFGAEVETTDDAPAAPRMSAADKKEIARNAETLEELSALADGEERKTVLEAIDKRAAELQADEG